MAEIGWNEELLFEEDVEKYKAAVEVETADMKKKIYAVNEGLLFRFSLLLFSYSLIIIFCIFVFPEVHLLSIAIYGIFLIILYIIDCYHVENQIDNFFKQSKLNINRIYEQC